VAERALRAAQGEAPYTVTLPQIPKDRPTGRKRTEAEEREHLVHVNPEQKSFRSRDFDARRDEAHADAVARRVRARADGLKKLVSDMDKEEAAATMTGAPGLATLNAQLEAAMID